MKNKISIYLFIALMVFAFIAFYGNLVYAKDLSDSTITFYEDNNIINKDIEFKPIENPNVAKNKMAPGMSAISDIELDFSNLDFDIELDIKLDDNYMDSFQLSYIINDTIYNEDDVLFLENKSDNVTVKLVLEWIPTNIDSYIGATFSQLNVPIHINIKENI